VIVVASLPVDVCPSAPVIVVVVASLPVVVDVSGYDTVSPSVTVKDMVPLSVITTRFPSDSLVATIVFPSDSVMTIWPASPLNPPPPFVEQEELARATRPVALATKTTKETLRGESFTESS
jgi:hypothetical protein